MEVLLKQFDRGLNILVAVIYVAFTVIAFAQIMVRFLGGSIPWSEEAVRYLFLWLCFLGFSVTMNRGGHIFVDFFINFLPPSARRALVMASDAVIVGFLVFLMIKGARIAQATWNNLSPAMQLPMGYLYLILPISAALLLFYTFRVAYRHWHGDFGPWTT